MHPKGDIRAELFVQQWRTGLHRFLNIDGSRQRFIIDFYQVASISSSVEIFSNDDCYRVTIETYLALGQRTASTHTLGNFSQGNSNGNVTNSALEVFRGVNSDNAGMFTSCIRINTVDASMTVGAAYYRHMKHARKFDIINIGRLTGDQAGVFTPFNRRTKHSCNTHVCISFLITRNSNCDNHSYLNGG